MDKKLNAQDFVTEIRKIYRGLPDTTTAMQHLLDACDIIESDQEKIKDMLAMLRNAGGFIDAIQAMKLVKPSARVDVLAEEIQAVIRAGGAG